MNEATVFYGLNPEEIKSLFLEIKSELKELKGNLEPKKPTEYLTRKEVSLLLKCNLSTIHNWTKKGTLIPYGIDGRVYYKRNEVESAIVPFGRNRGTSNEST